MLQWIMSKLRRRPEAPPPPSVVANVAPAKKHDDAMSILESFEVEFNGPEVAEMVGRICAEMEAGSIQIPPMPTSAAKMLELVGKPDIDLNQLVATLHWEPALVARILAVANSPAFRGTKGTPHDDLRGAMTALGLRTVGEIAAGVAARSLFQVESRMEYDLFPALWKAAHKETMVVAFAASAVAHARNLSRPDRVFLRAVLAGSARILALRALATQLIDGRISERASDDAITAAIDGAYRDVGALATKRGTLPIVLTTGADDLRENATVELVATLVELRRAPGRAAARKRAKTFVEDWKLPPSWLKVILRECEDAEGRVEAMLAA